MKYFRFVTVFSLPKWLLLSLKMMTNYIYVLQQIFPLFFFFFHVAKKCIWIYLFLILILTCIVPVCNYCSKIFVLVNFTSPWQPILETLVYLFCKWPSNYYLWGPCEKWKHSKFAINFQLDSNQKIDPIIETHLHCSKQTIGMLHIVLFFKDPTHFKA